MISREVWGLSVKKMCALREWFGLGLLKLKHAFGCLWITLVKLKFHSSLLCNIDTRNSSEIAAFLAYVQTQAFIFRTLIYLGVL